MIMRRRLFRDAVRAYPQCRGKECLFRGPVAVALIRAQGRRVSGQSAVRECGRRSSEIRCKARELTKDEARNDTAKAGAMSANTIMVLSDMTDTSATAAPDTSMPIALGPARERLAAMRMQSPHEAAGRARISVSSVIFLCITDLILFEVWTLRIISMTFSAAYDTFATPWTIEKARSV